MEQYMRYGGIAKNKKYKNRNKKLLVEWERLLAVLLVELLI